MNTELAVKPRNFTDQGEACFEDVKVVEMRPIHQPDGGPEGTCVTFRLGDQEGLAAVGQLWVAEPYRSVFPRLIAAQKRGERLTARGFVMIERHPDGQQWILGQMDIGTPMVAGHA